MKTANYFIPSMRRGLATAIVQPTGNKQRAEIDVNVHFQARKAGQNVFESDTVNMPFQIYGPGDVLGFHPRIVTRTYPEPDIDNFEPNFFPAVEFAQADFIWRYSPNVVKPNGSLQPWVTLIVLVAKDWDEHVTRQFTEGERTPSNLAPWINVKDQQSLPDLANAWRWAHVSVADDAERDLTGETLKKLFEDEPERAICRLICPRRLHEQTHYSAFVVPTFELGRLAALGEPADSGVTANTPAWPNLSGKLPYYYRWEFRTGEGGDFEELVRKLQPRVLKDVGTRKLNACKPGFGIEGEEIEIEGAFKPLSVPAATPASSDTKKAISELLQRNIDTPRHNYCVKVYPPTSSYVNEIEVDVLRDNRSVRIGFTTENDCISRIDYGESATYGHFVECVGYRTDHSLTITGLEPFRYLFSWDKVEDTQNNPGNEKYKLINYLKQEYGLEWLDPVHVIIRKINDKTIKVKGSFIWPPFSQNYILIKLNDTKTEAHLIISNDQRTDYFIAKTESGNLKIYLGSYHFKITVTGRDGTVRNTSDGRFTMPERLWVTPPIYGRWHKGDARLNPGASESWLDTLNLEPMYRAAAGLGTMVVRQNQEDLMSAAWEQLGHVNEANKILRHAQFGVEVAKSYHRRISRMDLETMLHVTAPVQGRILVDSTTSEFKTLSAHISEKSYLPDVAMQPAFRKLIKPRGAIRRRQGVQNRIPVSAAKGLLERLASKEIDVAGPIPRPGGTPNFGKSTKAFKPSVDPHNNIRSSQNRDFLGQNRDMVLHALRPEHTIVARTRSRLSLSKTSFQNLSSKDLEADTLDEIMAFPEFPQPMYVPLKEISQDLLLPGVSNIPPNTIALLETNRRFVESYLVGCNHEFAAELLWRLYPTDQRGSFFRQFWDVGEYIPKPDEITSDGELLESVRNRLRGISQIHTWGRYLFSWDDIPGSDNGRLIEFLKQNFGIDWVKTENIEKIDSGKAIKVSTEENYLLLKLNDEKTEVNLEIDDVGTDKFDTKIENGKLKIYWGSTDLGAHYTERPKGGYLFLLIRGDLLRRYPGVVIYSIESVPDSPNSKNFVPGLPEYVTDYDHPIEYQGRKINPIYPDYKGTLQPDITFLGFKLPDGMDIQSATRLDGGIYFVFEERVSELRFGLDVSAPEKFRTWNDLSWKHFFPNGGEGQDVDSGTLNGKLPEDDAGKTWDKNTNSATLAYLTLQRPVRVACHASKMIHSEYLKKIEQNELVGKSR